jgi:hypothetical protein
MPQIMRKKMKQICGFTLLESLISLTLFFFLFLGGISFFNSAKSHFFSIKAIYETNESLLAAADKIKLDLEQAGQGLATPMNLGLVRGLRIEPERVEICFREQEFLMDADLQPGQTKIQLPTTYRVGTGREICILDAVKGEKAAVISSGSGYMIISRPLQHGYSASDSRLLLIKQISLYLDRQTQILRRKVNTSSAQPLLEKATLFGKNYDEASHLLKITLRIQSKKEREYAFSIRPKNMLLAGYH